MMVKFVFFIQGQPPPEGGEGEREGEQGEDKKQKENTAYAKKMVLRLAGLMGLGGAVGMVYIFGECGCFVSTVLLQKVCFLLVLHMAVTHNTSADRSPQTDYFARKTVKKLKIVRCTNLRRLMLTSYTKTC